MTAIAPSVLQLGVTGAVATTSAAVARMPFTGVIAAGGVAVGTAPVGSALTGNILVNAVTVGSFSIGATQTSAEVSLDETLAFFNAGDVVTLDVTAIGSGTAGSNLGLTLSLNTGARPSEAVPYIYGEDVYPVMVAQSGQMHLPANDPLF